MAKRKASKRSRLCAMGRGLKKKGGRYAAAGRKLVKKYC